MTFYQNPLPADSFSIYKIKVINSEYCIHNETLRNRILYIQIVNTQLCKVSYYEHNNLNYINYIIC